MLFLSGGIPFASGVMEYLYNPIPPDDITRRILIKILIEKEPAIAVLHTGAPYLILTPEITDRLNYSSDNCLEQTIIRIRGDRFSGGLNRLEVRLIADTGESLAFEPLVFIPDPNQDERWNNLPLFIGIDRCLERIRFALDPLETKFYFGAIP